jgi:hypothetical protein
MKDFMRDEPGAPRSSTAPPFRPTWTHSGFGRKLTHEKATRLQPRAGLKAGHSDDLGTGSQ